MTVDLTGFVLTFGGPEIYARRCVRCELFQQRYGLMPNGEAHPDFPTTWRDVTGVGDNG